MVNRIVYDYLSKYGHQYKLSDLKNKILSKGYSEEDIDEAIRMLGLEERESEKKVEPRKLSNQGVVFKQEEKIKVSNGFRWMRFSGILGLLLMIAGLGVLVYFYFVLSSYTSIFQTSNLDITKKLIYSGILLLFSLLIIFFVNGFSKLAKYTGSRLIRFSSGIYLFLIIISLIAGLVYLFVNIDTNMARIFNISMVFLLFLFFLNSIFFFSGLTGLGKRVRFASVSGFFGWLLIISVLGVIAYMFYISGFNTSVFLSLQDAFSGQVKQYLIIPGFILGLIGAIIFLFESFILLSSSKTFE